MPASGLGQRHDPRSHRLGQIRPGLDHASQIRVVPLLPAWALRGLGGPVRSRIAVRNAGGAIGAIGNLYTPSRF